MTEPALYAEGNTRDLMPLFYSRLFPSRDMHSWLAYGNDSKLPGADVSFFQRREFCFTLENDVFVRYQSFKDAAELHAALRDRCPAKIDLGPVYNVDPQKRSAYGLGSGLVFAPVERELVFDDMTDYDDVRTCCSGGAICSKCWPFITVAIKVVNTVLREDFGFEHLLWVYSGRRGVHCWVCDEKARMLTNDQRSAVADFFLVSKGNDHVGKKVNLSYPLHPSLQRAYDEVLRSAFVEIILPEQGLLEKAERIDGVLAMIPDEAVRIALAERLKSGKRSAHSPEEEAARRWELVEKEVERAARQSKNAETTRLLQRSLVEIVFAHCFPRLDLEVSKKMNHLLKAPFCVHPKTGRICVPIDPTKADDFDPLTVPTVAQLLNELNSHSAKAADTGADDFDRTSMRTAVATFRSAFLQPLQAEWKRRQGRAQDGRKSTDW